MRLLNRTAVVVSPKKPFLDWLVRTDQSAETLTLSDLQSEPTVYLLPECDDDAAVRRRLRRVCGRIFEMELEGWCTEPLRWPTERGFAAFSEWFSWSVHSEIVDLDRGELRREEF